MMLPAGARLGSYEILASLGVGGMGEVYKARDTHLGREVALKVLPEAFGTDADRVARFEREARLLAAINHPGISAIYGAERSGDIRYIVLELVPGETLAQRMARAALSLEESLSFAFQIADALEAAHERGIIHRDLKPSNIKVMPNGKIKVLDFGLAKAVEQWARPGDVSKSPTLARDDHTGSGVILGTVEYMSPEQARGKELDKRTDIWAFGCVLFEMLAGRRAFAGETISDVLAAILRNEPDWSVLPSSTPPRIRELLSRCFSKDANHRLRDIGDARVEIEHVLSHGDEASTAAFAVAPRRLSRRGPAVAAALAGVAIFAAGWLALRSLRAASPSLPEHKQLVVMPLRNLTSDADAKWIGLGLVETVSVRLSGLPGLQVVRAPQAVSVAGREPEELRTARHIGANLAVLGTLQREGDRMRITYRVLDLANGAQVAAKSLDGSASDLFALQDSLADSLARDLRFPGTVRRSTVSPGLDASQQAHYLQSIGLLQRYDKRDAVDQALQLLRGLAEERPNSALVQAALGRANLAMFDFTKERGWADRAAAAADAARSLDPALPEVDVTVGETLLATGRPKEAIESFRHALSANPDDFPALLGLGRASESAGYDAAAEAALRRAVELQPSSFAARNQLGALMADRGRWAEAAKMFEWTTRLVPDSYRAFSNLGGVLTMSCDFPAAIEAYNKALALRPDHAIALSNIGLTETWVGRYSDAIAHLEMAVRQAPNEYLIWGNLGDAYRAVAGQEQKAAAACARSIALARERLRLNPRDATAHSSLGSELAKTGHATEAAKEIRRALDIDAKDPNVLANAAVVAILAGRTSEAIAWLRRAADAGFCRVVIARQPEFLALRGEPDFLAIVGSPRQTSRF